MPTRKTLAATIALVFSPFGGLNRAHAEQITVGFTATVFYIDNCCLCVPGAIEIGDTVIGYYTYESPAVDTDPDPKIGRYVYSTTPSRLVAHLEGYVFQTDAANVNIEFTVSDSLDIGGGPRDRYRFTSWSNKVSPFGYPTTRLQVYFDDETLQALSDDSLPTSPPDLDIWSDSHAVGMLGDTWGVYANIIATQWGTPTSARGIVPEPQAWIGSAPNPFGHSTTLTWSAVEGNVTLRVFDVTGKLVRTLVEEAPTTFSTNSVVWDGRDEARRPLPSGIYFVRLSTPSLVEIRKVVLLR